MSRVYTVTFSAVAVTAAQDLFALTAADDKPIRMLGWVLQQHSDFGDAQDEIIQLRIRRGQTADGSAGTAPTPQPVDPHDAAAGFTARVNDTTQAGTGTINTLFVGGYNVRAGEVFLLPERMQFQTDQGSNKMTLELSTAPADSITMEGTLWVEEL